MNIGVKSKILFLMVIMMSMVCSCSHHTESYPRELVEADSAMSWGDYDRMDSLLHAYHLSKGTGSEADHMYDELLGIGLSFMRGTDTKNIDRVDSLCAYYKKKDWKAKYGRALLFRGAACNGVQDNPSALKSYLEAMSVARQIGDMRLMSWIYKEEGDLYYFQDMYPECVDAYRNYYRYASMNHDIRRMAHAAFRMGRVYTILDNVDSVLYYYQHCMDLGRHLKDSTNFILPAKKEISDIYIQIGEYDEAQKIMTSDSIFDIIKAYFHSDQQQTDSAIYYFKKAKPYHNYSGQAYCLLQLANLEKERGNALSALQYYGEYAEMKDSANEVAKTKELNKVKAQYEYRLMEEERDNIASKDFDKGIVIVSLLVVLLFLVVSFYFVSQSYRSKKDSLLAHESLLRIEEERKNRLSQQQILANNLRIKELEKQLTEATARHDADAIKQINLDAELLNIENKSIKASQHRTAYFQQRLKESDLYHRLITNAGKDNFRLNDGEWQELMNMVDDAYSGFNRRLLQIAKLNEAEVRMCCLRKLGLSSVTISKLLFKTDNAISMMRVRVYKKLMGEKGTGRQLDEFLKNF